MRILIFAVLALLSLAAFAGVYSWKDADGKTIYSDRPPPDKADVRKLDAPPSPATKPYAPGKAQTSSGNSAEPRCYRKDQYWWVCKR